MPFDDFQSAVSQWRENEAFNGHDPVGDAQATRENARFLQETYCDEDPECTCQLSGDLADASDCEAHGLRQNKRSRTSIGDGASNYNHGQMNLFDVESRPVAAVRLIEAAGDLLLDLDGEVA